MDSGAVGTDWVTFVETMIQLYITHTTGRGVYVALNLPSLKCDPTLLLNGVDKNCSHLVIADSRSKYIVSKGQNEIKRSMILTIACICE